MANVEGVPNSSSSQFFITLTHEPLTHLDGKYVAFGRVKSGSELLKTINYYGDSQDGIPRAIIEITDCGVFIEKPKPTDEDPKLSAIFAEKIQQISNAVITTDSTNAQTNDGGMSTDQNVSTAKEGAVC